MSDHSAPMDAATPAASVPAADILALAKEFQDEADERNRATGDKRNCYEKWDAAQRLRTLVAAAEQADKGEAADTPRDEEAIKCPTCGVARGWNEDGFLTRGIWTLNCVRCGSFQVEIEDAPDEAEGKPPTDVADNLIRLLRKENTELRTQLRALGGVQPVEANYAPPWWVGLLHWRRWLRDRAARREDA